MEISNLRKSDLVKRHLPHAMDYSSYRALVADLALKGRSTAPEQTDSLTDYTKLNDSRMRRLDKTLVVPDEVKRHFEAYEGRQTWLVITESWCGDAAQTLPVMHRLSELNDGITLRLILRDSFPELMDAFLTSGTRSIPVLIAIDPSTAGIIDTWGPRPSAANEMATAYKEAHGALSPEFKKELQVWYNKDKGRTTMNDLLKFVS